MPLPRPPCRSGPGCWRGSGTVLCCAAWVARCVMEGQLYSADFCVLYCSHETQTTCWDHPKMTELYQSLGKTPLSFVWFFSGHMNF